METAVIDGFEGDLARLELEGGQVVHLPRRWLPPEAGEGDVLAVEAGSGGEVRFRVDEEGTARARKEAVDLLGRATSEPPEDFHL